jgi:hypothetical protein
VLGTVDGVAVLVIIVVPVDRLEIPQVQSGGASLGATARFVIHTIVSSPQHPEAPEV